MDRRRRLGARRRLCNNFVTVPFGHLRPRARVRTVDRVRVSLVELGLLAVAVAVAATALPRCSGGAKRAVVRANWGLTPGVLNPAVTQPTIRATICKRGWTRTVRPPVSYTNALKAAAARAVRAARAAVGVPGGPPDQPRAGRQPDRSAQPLAGAVPARGRRSTRSRTSSTTASARGRSRSPRRSGASRRSSTRRASDGFGGQRVGHPREQLQQPFAVCRRQRGDRRLEGDRRARLALVDERPAGGRQLDPDRPAVVGVGRARDEAELVERRRPRGSPWGRSFPCGRRGRSGAAGRRRRSRSARSAASRSSRGRRRRRRSCASAPGAACRAGPGSPRCRVRRSSHRNSYIPQ